MKMDYEDLINLRRTFNEWFSPSNLQSVEEFIEDLFKEDEKKEDEKTEGVFRYDEYRDGKHVKHIVKEKRDGEWKPVEGKCCCLGHNDENTEKEMGAKEKPLDSCCIRPATPEDLIPKAYLIRKNKELSEENEQLKNELKSYANEMKRINTLMESMAICIKEYTENRK